MIKTATVNWIEKLKLEGRTDNGKIVMMDSGETAAAASPAQLILQALAGCTMMDCVVIFVKQRKEFKKFWVDIEAEEAEKNPKVFTSVNLKYNIVSSDLTDADVKRAIELSEEKFCRVHAMLSPKVKLTSSFEIIRQ